MSELIQMGYPQVALLLAAVTLLARILFKVGNIAEQFSATVKSVSEHDDAIEKHDRRLDNHGFRLAALDGRREEL